MPAGLKIVYSGLRACRIMGKAEGGFMELIILFSSTNPPLGLRIERGYFKSPSGFMEENCSQIVWDRGTTMPIALVHRSTQAKGAVVYYLDSIAVSVPVTLRQPHKLDIWLRICCGSILWAKYTLLLITVYLCLSAICNMAATLNPRNVCNYNVGLTTVKPTVSWV